MKANLAILLTSLALGAAAPAFAHHSFAAEFDDKKPVTLQGTVNKVEFMNPHIWIYLDVKDESGKVEHWQCEGGAPNGLRRQGWSTQSLKQGDAVHIAQLRKTIAERAFRLIDKQGKIDLPDDHEIKEVDEFKGPF